MTAIYFLGISGIALQPLCHLPYPRHIQIPVRTRAGRGIVWAMRNRIVHPTSSQTTTLRYGRHGCGNCKSPLVLSVPPVLCPLLLRNSLSGHRVKGWGAVSIGLRAAGLAGGAGPTAARGDRAGAAVSALPGMVTGWPAPPFMGKDGICTTYSYGFWVYFQHAINIYILWTNRLRGRSIFPG